MSSVAGILGPAFATAAESYLRSISPQADLEREQIAAKRQLIPMQVEAERLKNQRTQERMQPELDLLKAQAEHQRQLAVKGTGSGRDIIRVNAGLYLERKQNPDGSYRYDPVKADQSVHGQALIQDLIRDEAAGTITPGGAAVLQDYRAGKQKLIPPTETRPPMVWSPYGGVAVTGQPSSPAAPSPTAPRPRPGAARPGTPSAPAGAAPASPGGKYMTPLEPEAAQVQVRQTYLSKLGLPGAQKLLTETMQNDTELQQGRNPSPITMAWVRAFQGAFPGQEFVTPDLRPPGKGRPSGTAPGTPGTVAPLGGGTLTTGQRTPEQVAAEQAKQEAERRKASGLPPYKPEQVAKAVELFPFLGNPPRMQLLTPAQMTLVDQAIRADKETSGFHRVLKQAMPLLSEQASMDSSANFAKWAETLIAPETVGARGRANRLRQQMIEQLPISERAKRLMGGFDERIPDLEVVAHAIGYVHANAMKRIGGAGGGGGRGVTQFDIKEITGWFDPFATTTSARELRAKLRELQGLIQMVRPQVEHDLRVLGVDPKTHGPIKGYNYGAPEGESTPPEGDVNQEIDQLRQGR